eukprot:Hpha_TRINITY_DN15321_c1_g5::TRINITY_DN15321_c1_g5_i1::g.89645::m.89645
MCEGVHMEHSAALWSVYDPPLPSCPRFRCAERRKEPLWRLVCLEKGSDEPMGTTWWKGPRGNVVLRSVRAGTPADHCGLAQCVGWLLSHVNGVPVEQVKLESLRSLSEIRLRFVPLTDVEVEPTEHAADPNHP